VPENEIKVYILYRCIVVDWSVVVIIIIVVGGGGGGRRRRRGHGFDVEFIILCRKVLQLHKQYKTSNYCS